MKIDIYLISTVHTEKGACTCESLFKILNQIKPDVVFCESSTEMLESFKKGIIQSSLELNAIEKLSIYNSFSLVAVDTYPAPDRNFRYQVNIMFDSFAKDKEHTNAWRKNYVNTYKFGFEYLNSDENIEIFNEMVKRENHIIIRSANTVYKDVYTKWKDILNNRENEMLENINTYAENNKFKRAVFLCGSSHRKAIMSKIKENNNIRMKWHFELPT